MKKIRAIDSRDLQENMAEVFELDKLGYFYSLKGSPLKYGKNIILADKLWLVVGIDTDKDGVTLITDEAKLQQFLLSK